MSDRKRPDVPQVIQDAERDLKRDVPGALSLVGNILFGDFFAKHGFVDKAQEQHIPPPAAPQVIDVEPVIESPVCPTCRGAGSLGRKGHEVPCPACVKKCETCGGRGKLGAAGHEVPCPRCTP